MREALVHRKLRRVAVIAEKGEEEEDAAPELTGLDDPRKSAVFERFAYLPPALAWDLQLRNICMASEAFAAVSDGSAGFARYRVRARQTKSHHAEYRRGQPPLMA